MDRIRTYTGYLFLAAGILHLVTILFLAFNLTWIITAIFGVVYLILGYSVLRGGMTIVLVGAVIALLGAILSIAGLVTQGSLVNIVFLLLDIAILAGCGYLLVKGRRYLKLV